MITLGKLKTYSRPLSGITIMLPITMTDVLCHAVQMLLFAEGTRFTPAKHKASMEFARKRGLPELKRHLIPRTRGFIQCVQSLKGNFPVMYDVTVGFNM